MEEHVSFSAKVIPGAGRGKNLGSPTINMETADVPAALSYGIYACYAQLDEEHVKFAAALHYGPRLVFDNVVTCEAHLLHAALTERPQTVQVEIIAYLREVKNFPSIEDLQKQIQQDIVDTERILRANFRP